MPKIQIKFSEPKQLLNGIGKIRPKLQLKGTILISLMLILDQYYRIQILKLQLQQQLQQPRLQLLQQLQPQQQEGLLHRDLVVQSANWQLPLKLLMDTNGQIACWIQTHLNGKI